VLKVLLVRLVAALVLREKPESQVPLDLQAPQPETQVKQGLKVILVLQAPSSVVLRHPRAYSIRQLILALQLLLFTIRKNLTTVISLLSALRIGLQFLKTGSICCRLVGYGKQMLPVNV
jgi:hypothetical protein